MLPSFKSAIISISIFLFIIILTSYIYYTSEIIQEKILKNLETRISNKQILEMTKLGMEQMRNNPILLISPILELTFLKLYTLFSFILVNWILIIIWFERKFSFIEIFYSGLTASILLAFGTLIEIILIFFTGHTGSHFGLELFINTFSLNNLMVKIIKNYNIFTLLYFYTFSFFIAKFFKENIITLFIISLLSCLILIFISYITGINWYISPAL